MSVAALSTASSILTATPSPAPAAGAAAVNDSQPFARLIGKPTADGKAPKGEAKTAPDADVEAEVSADTIGDDGATATTDAKDVIDTGETDILAGIEAMVAAASQLVVVPSAVATTATATITAPVATVKADASAKTVLGSVAKAAAAMPAPITTSTVTPTPAPAATTALPAQAPATGGGDTDAQAPTVDAAPIAAALPEGAAISSSIPAPKAVKTSDIASILAALKSSAAAQDIAPQATETVVATSDVASAQILGKPVIAPTGEDKIVARTAPQPTVPSDVTPKTIEASVTTSEQTAEAVAPLVAEAPRAKAEAKDGAKTVVAATTADIPAAAALPIQADQPVVTTPVAAQAQAAAIAPAATPVQEIPVAAATPQPRAATAPAIPANDDRDVRAATAAPAKARRNEAPAANDDNSADFAAIVSPPLAPMAATAAPSTAPLSDGPAVESATATLAGQSVDRQIDLARDSKWLDQLARDINQAATMQSNLKFQLNPEHLGSLHIEISNGADGASIRMTTDNDQARAIIADAQPKLLAEVRAQGLQVAGSHVDMDNRQQQNGGNAWMSGGQLGEQQQQRRSSEDHKPFPFTPTNQRDVPSDSVARNDGELYA